MALALGMTVEELGERMSGLELQEWMAFDRLSPIGDDRGDLQAGIIASTVANAHRSRGRPFRPQDFMPFLQQEETEPLAVARKLKRQLEGGA